jgi:hypothetical protein
MSLMKSKCWFFKYFLTKQVRYNIIKHAITKVKPLFCRHAPNVIVEREGGGQQGRREPGPNGTKLFGLVLRFGGNKLVCLARENIASKAAANY